MQEFLGLCKKSRHIIMNIRVIIQINAHYYIFTVYKHSYSVVIGHFVHFILQVLLLFLLEFL